MGSRVEPARPVTRRIAAAMVDWGSPEWVAWVGSGAPIHPLQTFQLGDIVHDIDSNAPHERDRVVKKLNLSVIKTDGSTQGRVSMSQDTVLEYAAHMRDGDKFPPIVVFHDGSEYWLGDGFHRFFATKQNGQVSIECEVRQGTQRDAKLYGMSANAKRGLSMSMEDVRRNVQEMLTDPEWKLWTQADIARHCGCSQMTVSRVKSAMEKEGVEVEKGTKEVMVDGKKRTVNTNRIGKKKAEEERPEEPKFENDDRIMELTDTVTTLEQENEKLKDAIAVGQWDASEIEKIDAQELIDELRERIRVLEIDNTALRDSRDMFQQRNAELLKTVKSLQAKLKKYEKG